MDVVYTHCKHHHKHNSSHRLSQPPKRQDTATCKLLPEHIHNIRAQSTCDLSISELTSEITSLIQTDKSGIWREHLDRWNTNIAHTHSLQDNTWISQQKSTHKKWHNNFERENNLLTHINRKPQRPHFTNTT